MYMNISSFRLAYVGKFRLSYVDDWNVADFCTHLASRHLDSYTICVRGRVALVVLPCGPQSGMGYVCHV